jgi:hypothetical protein
MKSLRALSLIGVALGSSFCAHPSPNLAARFSRERLVSSPSSIAFVSSDRVATGLSDEIRFGGPRGRSALYLKFPSDFRGRGIPQRAFLTLSAREGSASSDTPLTLEAWHINADWRPGTLQQWSDKPSLAPPYARTRVSSSPAQDLRIDVTELVRFAAQNPERDFGIAVIASGSAGPGASFNSGLAGGRAPSLELYLR